MIALDPLLKDEIEFQIALHPDAWGHGYGEEALRQMLAYAFERLSLPYVMGVNDALNEGSRRLQEKMGFVRQREVEGPVGTLVITNSSAIERTLTPVGRTCKRHARRYT